MAQEFQRHHPVGAELLNKGNDINDSDVAGPVLPGNEA